MTDLLEKAIRENRDAFDDEAPIGHFDRFEEKLDRAFSKKKKLSPKFWLQVAAAVVFVLLIGNQVRMYLDREEVQPVSLASVSPEYGEAEFYYTAAIDQGLHEWDKLIKDGIISAEEQQAMEQEMKEFDETYSRLQNELKANPEDERVINAMLELYQAKLSIITMIITKLEDIKQQKLTKDGTEI